MSAEILLSRLEKVRRTGPGRWLARCPAHGDRGPSLSIRELEDQRILVHDFGGCTVEAVLAAVNLQFSDLFPERAETAAPGRERIPFPAADILRAVAFETLVVSCAAGKLAAGEDLSKADRERLAVAAERLQGAVEWVR